VNTVPKRTEAHRTEKRLEQEGIAAGSQTELKRLLVNEICASNISDIECLSKLRTPKGSSDQCECTQVGLALELSQHRVVFILEFTRPNDGADDWQTRTDTYKEEQYCPLWDKLAALLPGWKAETISFSLGIRGLYNEEK
jgi:hypothetical protein